MLSDLLGLIREGSPLPEEGRRNTRGTAHAVSMGIREGGSRSKMISTSAQLLTPNLTLEITISLLSNNVEPVQGNEAIQGVSRHPS